MKNLTKNKSKMTQYDYVLNHLKVYGEITPLDAYMDYAIMRLGAIIYEMRKDGYNLETNYTTLKNRFGSSVTYATYVYKEC